MSIKNESILVILRGCFVLMKKITLKIPQSTLAEVQGLRTALYLVIK